MIIQLKKILFCATAFGFFTELNAQNISPKGLKDYYKAYFPIGVAVSPQLLTRAEESALILQNFNSLTPENAMKMAPIHPKENTYHWEDSDKIVAFAQKNGLKIRGHNLCWHNQTPDWFFTKDGREVTKEELLARLKQHITEVVSHYKGKIYVWDVVNEAVPDTGNSIYRNSKFYKIIGEEYIAKAFEYAHEADPNALLFYNDYNTESQAKRAKIYQLLKTLRQKGVPIHGVGLQAHWSIFEPTSTELEASISQFASLGLQVQITELDISVHPKEHESRDKKLEDVSVYSEEMEKKQIQQYKMVFDVFRKYKNTVTSVTFWNLSDQSSWLDNFPVKGRKDYPLLFDQSLKPKKAFWEVVNF